MKNKDKFIIIVRYVNGTEKEKEFRSLNQASDFFTLCKNDMSCDRLMLYGYIDGEKRLGDTWSRGKEVTL